MSTTAANLTTLFGALTGITELATSVGMSIGGKLPDPSAVTVPTPSAWLLYAGQTPVDPDHNGVVARKRGMKKLFIVMVYLDNSQGQDVLIASQLPILGKVVNAVNGIDSSDQLGGFRFSFDGERLTSVNPKRLIYEMRFSILSHT